MTQSAESVETEAALVRSQLVAIGAELRHQADPAVIVDAAKTSFKRRTDSAPSFLKQNATPIGMVMLGGALGAAVTGLFSRRAPSGVAPSGKYSAARTKGVESPSLGSKVNASVLSAVSVGLGYFAAMFIPSSATEDRLLGEPKAVLRQRLDEFLQQHSDGVKKATANALGLSRLSATTLVGLAMLADVLGANRRDSKTDLK
jgi:hypothetical protein